MARGWYRYFRLLKAGFVLAKAITEVFALQILHFR